jgi:hypothetical protein
MQGNTAEKPVTARLTGAWERNGKFGSFYVGKLTVDDINKAIAELGNDVSTLEIIVSPVNDKKSDKSPDMSISFRLPREQDQAGNTSSGGRGGFGGGAGGAPRRPYNGKK